MSHSGYNAAGKGRPASGPVGTITPPSMDAVMSSNPSPAGKNPKPAQPFQAPKPATARTTTTAAAAKKPESGPRPSSLPPAVVAAARAASTRAVKPALELWQCNQCSAALDKGCVAAGTADIVEGKLLCAACLSRGKAEAAHGRRRIILLAGAVALTLAGAVSVFAYQRAAERAEQQQQVAQLNSAAETISELLTKDQCLQALRQVKALEERAATMDPHSALQAQALINESKQKVDGWFERTYGHLEPAEQKILVNLLASYGNESDIPLQILSLRLEHGKLTLKVVGSLPESGIHPGQQRAGAVVLNDGRPLRAMDEARVFLIFVFNSFAEVSLVELQWYVKGRDEPAEFGTFTANRRQLSRLEEPSCDLRYLSDKREEPQQME